MMDPKNFVGLSFGLVAEPEPVNDGKIIKLRGAADYAGQEKGTDNRSGYFDITYFVNDTPNAKFVADQVAKKNFKKGSQLQLVGRLVQERWEKDGNRNSKVVIVAEAITYASGSGGGKDKAEAATVADSPLPTRF